MRTKMATLCAAAMLMVGLRPAPASASPITYNMNINGCSGSGGCGTMPAAQVTLNDFGLTGDVQVTVSPFNGNKFVNTGLDSTFDFNLIGNPVITVTGLTAGFSLVSTTAGSHMMSAFKDFEYAIQWNTSGGGNGTAGPLTFHVLALGVTSASFAEASSGTGGEHVFFAADIFSGQTGNTGGVGGSDPCTMNCPSTNQVTPEPLSAVLLGSGLVLAARKIRRKRAS
ncbi:MAG: hypothetical protein V4486_02545 [Patescibacteria group bacterium]